MTDVNQDFRGFPEPRPVSLIRDADAAGMLQATLKYNAIKSRGR